MKTIAEFVLPGHPDKICDKIADLLVDAACTRDPRSLVGVEVALHQHKVFITGCISTSPPMTLEEVALVVKKAFIDAGYGDDWAPHPEDLSIFFDLRLEPLDNKLRHLRSISDDQAICVGYATNDRKHHYLPKAHRLAYVAGQEMKNLRQQYNLGPDGKVIVCCCNNVIDRISLSLHHKPQINRSELYKMAGQVAAKIGLFNWDRISVNGGGDFDVGGPFGDNGLSGKKLVMDAYGPMIPIGGGAWSGKDPHKIDRSGGLMARWLALRAIRLGIGQQAKVLLGWHPGDQTPTTKQLTVDGKIRPISLLGSLDLTLDGLYRRLGLQQVQFATYADGSWFQKSAPWEAPMALLKNTVKQNDYVL